ncbi:hypothetical protein FAI41_08040 [Acetobacteraceae bacterium]|nr:hypothetical protein FAI41_08040 [Acetobacteraceae bacterium]
MVYTHLNASPTLPGGGLSGPSFVTKNDLSDLSHHYNATMRQVQTGMADNNSSPVNIAKDSVSGALNTTALTPSVTGFESTSNNAFLRPDTLSGALNGILGETSAQQVSWLQKAELLKTDVKDTISAAGPDALRHMDNISVQGNPHFINGTVQDTIRAVGVTVSGGATPFSDTISGTFSGFGHGETAPLTPYIPLPFKDSSGNLLYPKDGILPEGASNDSFIPGEPDKNVFLDPHRKMDTHSSLIDLLHQVDHQVTVDLGKFSGVSSSENASKIDSFNPDMLKKTMAHTTDEVLSAAKKDDSLITLLDEEQKKRMAANIDFGPFGTGGHF